VMVWSAFHFDGSDKEVQRGSESQQHLGTGGSDFGLDIGKASGGEEDADAFADLVAVERLAWFLGERLEQVVTIRHARQFDRLDGAPGVFRHGGESGEGLRGLRLLRRMRRGR